MRPDATARIPAAAIVLALLCLTAMPGCFHTVWASFNDRLAAPAPDATTATRDLRATKTIVDVRGDRQTTVFLAISGGGSRSAYFATCCMFEMGDLLKEVDVISTVSGGSLPGAYYCITEDPSDAKRRNEEATLASSVLKTLYLQRIPYHIWREQPVKRLMRKNFLRYFFLKWISPAYSWRHWWTAWDRSDTMSQVFADQVFYAQPWPFRTITTYAPSLLRQDYVMGELNPERPYLILNATSGTVGSTFGEPFTFTREDFNKLYSEIRTYSLSRAVMATAAFPAAMNHMTLRDYRAEAQPPRTLWKRRYLHVFDGGVYDNLSLTSVIRAIDEMERREASTGKSTRKYVVILLDAHVEDQGVSAKLADPRESFLGTMFNDFLSASDILLKANRQRLIDRMKNLQKSKPQLAGRLQFIHLTFDLIAPGSVRIDERGRPLKHTAGTKASDDEATHDLRGALNRIKTNFKISDFEANAIDTAVAELFKLKRPELEKAIGRR